MHNYHEYYNQDSAEVTSEDAIRFKNWMRSDKFDFERVRPYYPIHYDRNFEFYQDRKFFLLMLMLGAALVGGYKKY